MEREIRKIHKSDKESVTTIFNKIKFTLVHFWQAPYQILLIILLKEFIELSINMELIIKNVKRAELRFLRITLNTQN